MYTRLGLGNFKGFLELSLELRPLTLLSGLNGMGKSSILQSMLLLRQSYLQRASVGSQDDNLSLILNGDLVQLGTGNDVFYNRVDYTPERYELSFTLENDGAGTHTWRYEFDSDADVLNPTQVSRDTEFTYETSLFLDNFHYLRAERVGPRTAFGMSDYIVRQRRQIGTGGEYATHFLQIFAKTIHVEEGMRHPSVNSTSLEAQVTAWMSEISPGTQIVIRDHPEMDLMSLRFGFPGTPSFRSTNVGFGITYTFPVLVALLSSRPNGLVFLENPEAHLHPKGQFKMGELIARAASAGVQIILETHSDHILNGVRVATKSNLIDAQNVALHYLERTDENISGTKVVSPRLSQNGRLDFWPEGFFDEWDNSLDALM